jgi:hypothetical protein
MQATRGARALGRSGARLRAAGGASGPALASAATRAIGGKGIPDQWGQPASGGTKFLGTPSNYNELLSKRPLSPDLFGVEGARRVGVREAWGVRAEEEEEESARACVWATRGLCRVRVRCAGASAWGERAEEERARARLRGRRSDGRWAWALARGVAACANACAGPGPRGDSGACARPASASSSAAVRARQRRAPQLPAERAARFLTCSLLAHASLRRRRDALQVPPGRPVLHHRAHHRLRAQRRCALATARASRRAFAQP